MRSLLTRRWLAGASVLALCACGILPQDDQGRDLSVGLVSPFALADAHDQAAAWLQREDYTILETAPQLVRGEKRTPLASGGGTQRDVLTVTLSADADGTHVSIHAITYLLENGESRQAAQLSEQARSDAERLAQRLTGGGP